MITGMIWCLFFQNYGIVYGVNYDKCDYGRGGFLIFLLIGHFPFPKQHLFVVERGLFFVLKNNIHFVLEDRQLFVFSHFSDFKLEIYLDIKWHVFHDW